MSTVFPLNASLQQTLSPLNVRATERGLATVGASSALLFVDHPNPTSKGSRTLFVHNFSSNSASVGLFLETAGSSGTGLSFGNADFILEPGNAVSLPIGAGFSVAAVSSSGSVSVNKAIYDT